MPKPGQKVRVYYRGRLADGTVFDTNEGKEPLEFTLGAGQVIPGFDKAVQKMKVGDDITVEIPCKEAYGEHDEDNVVKVPLEKIPNSAQLPVNQVIWFRNQKGQPFSAIVTKIENGIAHIDTNHRLAGKDLIFDLCLVDVEGGTEEVNPAVAEAAGLPTNPMLAGGLPGLSNMPSLAQLQTKPHFE